MSFWIHEQHGTWVLVKTGPDAIVPGAVPLPYELYLKFKDNPADIPGHYERKDGKIVAVEPKELK